MTGPIRGAHLSVERKQALLEAVQEAKGLGLTIRRACEVLGLRRERLYFWRMVSCLADRKPGPLRAPHALLAEEKQAILEAARDEGYAHLRSVKLAHTLGGKAR